MTGLTDKYSISVDRKAALVRIRVRGFFLLSDVGDFAAAQVRAYDQLPTGGDGHITLCDVSECKIQQQEVVEAFRRLLNDKSIMSMRIAFVTGTSPAKMQVRRLINREGARFFDTAEAAEIWLLSDSNYPPRALAKRQAALVEAQVSC